MRPSTATTLGPVAPFTETNPAPDSSRNRRGRPPATVRRAPWSGTRQYVPPRTDYDGTEHEGEAGSRWKVLVIGADERYLPMGNGRLFSTGNHPVGTLLPLVHLEAAGFGIDVATVSGNPVKLEWWATPAEDTTVHDALDRFLPRFRAPRPLTEVLEDGLDDYLAVFVPGGHGAMRGLHDSHQVRAVLDWALSSDRFIITLCHGPAALLAAGLDRDTSPLAGYESCAFPDALDTGANLDIGYIPGPMPWLLTEGLRAQGLVVVNEDMAGHVHRDRGLLTGDSPLAANALGKLAAATLVERTRS